MQRLIKLVLLTGALLLVISACTSTTSSPSTSDTPSTAVPEKTGEESENDLPAFDADNFSNPTKIDNQWMPMIPGTKYTYEGVTVEDDGTELPHQVVIHVTDLTKVIGGLRSVVSWDLDYADGELVEAELAFFAQDDEGNVWRMGEFPVEYDGEEIVASPTWIHGIQEAHAGIMMQADPKTGTPSYAQGWAPAVDWTDRGQVDQLGQETCVPVTCYKDVLVIAETSASEPDAEQLKYYAPGVGNVRVGWRGAGEKTKETLELVALEKHSSVGLADMRTQAWELEKLAYQESPDVYALTQPSTDPDGATIIVPKPAEAPVGEAPQEATEEIVIYASDLAEEDVTELEFWDDPASPDGVMIGLTNTGDELDAPPENDPHASFEWIVQSGGPYRCWIHMKVGAPMGKSQANRIHLQFSAAVDKANQTILKPRSNSFLTAQGPTQEGWAWVGCDLEGTDSLFYFTTNGESTIRIQAGMEGVGFDQLVLSPAMYLDMPPSDPIVKK